jgi:hypothetical protein
VQSCEPIAAVIEMMKATPAFHVESRVALDPEQSARVVAWYNAKPPESDYTFNIVVLLRHANHEVGLLLGNDGLVCIAALIPADAVPELLRVIVGQAA